MFCPAPRHFSGPELLARCSRIHSVLFLHSQWRNEGSRGQKRLKCVPPRFFFGGGGGKGLGSEMLCTKLATKTATVCCDRQVITFRSLIRLYHVSVFVFASRKIFSAKLSRALSFAAPEGNCSPPSDAPVRWLRHCFICCCVVVCLPYSGTSAEFWLVGSVPPCRLRRRKL